MYNPPKREFCEKDGQVEQNVTMGDDGPCTLGRPASMPDLLKYNCSGSQDGALVGKVCKEFISYQAVK